MALAGLILLSLIALLWLWLLLSPAHRATFTDCLDSSTESPASQTALPPVCVILAARNEAEMLPRTIPTICTQEYPQLRVIVVDDQSDDDTPRVLEQLQREHANLMTILGTERPSGWVGKCWAIQQGVEHLKTLHFPHSTPNPLFLFTDADIVFHPRAVSQAVSHLFDRDLDMLS